MTCVEQILTESRDIMAEQLQFPGTTPVEKLQYKIMAKNLNTMLNFVVWMQNMRQPKKTR